MTARLTSLHVSSEVYRANDELRRQKRDALSEDQGEREDFLEPRLQASNDRELGDACESR